MAKDYDEKYWCGRHLAFKLYHAITKLLKSQSENEGVSIQELYEEIKPEELPTDQKKNFKRRIQRIVSEDSTSGILVIKRVNGTRNIPEIRITSINGFK